MLYARCSPPPRRGGSSYGQAGNASGYLNGPVEHLPGHPSGQTGRLAGYPANNGQIGHPGVYPNNGLAGPQEHATGYPNELSGQHGGYSHEGIAQQGGLYNGPSGHSNRPASHQGDYPNMSSGQIYSFNKPNSHLGDHHHGPTSGFTNGLPHRHFHHHAVTGYSNGPSWQVAGSNGSSAHDVGSNGSPTLPAGSNGSPTPPASTNGQNIGLPSCYPGVSNFSHGPTGHLQAYPLNGQAGNPDGYPLNGQAGNPDGYPLNGQAGNPDGYPLNGQAGNPDGYPLNGQAGNPNGYLLNGQAGNPNGYLLNGQAGNPNGYLLNGQAGNPNGYPSNGQSQHLNGYPSYQAVHHNGYSTGQADHHNGYSTGQADHRNWYSTSGQVYHPNGSYNWSNGQPGFGSDPNGTSWGYSIGQNDHQAYSNESNNQQGDHQPVPCLGASYNSGPNGYPGTYYNKSHGQVGDGYYGPVSYFHGMISQSGGYYAASDEQNQAPNSWNQGYAAQMSSPSMDYNLNPAETNPRANQDLAELEGTDDGRYIYYRFRDDQELDVLPRNWLGKAATQLEAQMYGDEDDAYDGDDSCLGAEGEARLRQAIADQPKAALKNLPPTMKQEEFHRCIKSPKGAIMFRWVKGCNQTRGYRFSRAYFAFPDKDKRKEFFEQFDKMVVKDYKEREFQARVAVASGDTDTDDEDEEDFDQRRLRLAQRREREAIKLIENPPPRLTPDDFLAEIEAREAILKQNGGVLYKRTPLTAYVEKLHRERRRLAGYESGEEFVDSEEDSDEDDEEDRARMVQYRQAILRRHKKAEERQKFFKPYLTPPAVPLIDNDTQTNEGTKLSLADVNKPYQFQGARPKTWQECYKSGNKNKQKQQAKKPEQSVRPPEPEVDKSRWAHLPWNQAKEAKKAAAKAAAEEAAQKKAAKEEAAMKARTDRGLPPGPRFVLPVSYVDKTKPYELKMIKDFPGERLAYKAILLRKEPREKVTTECQADF